MLRQQLGIDDSLQLDQDSLVETKRISVKNQEYEFWQRRARNARWWVICISSSNMFYQLMALLNPVTPQHFWMNVLYTFCSLISAGFTFQTYINPAKLQRNIEGILLYIQVRNLIRVWDFE